MLNEEFKNKEIINKIDYNKEIIKEKININKEEIKYDKLFKVTSFSSLIGAVSSTRTSTKINRPTQTQIQQQTPMLQQQLVTPPSQSPTPIQGQSYDVDQMWSPISNAGNIYEWSRGVISIGKDGTIAKENLDSRIGAHHGGATVRTLINLDITIEIDEFRADIEPFPSGVEGAKKGAIVFQSEGNEVLLYFPESITEEQLESLSSVLTPRENFNYSFTHNEEIFSDKSLQEVIEFSANIRNLSAGVSR